MWKVNDRICEKQGDLSGFVSRIDHNSFFVIFDDEIAAGKRFVGGFRTKRGVEYPFNKCAHKVFAVFTETKVPDAPMDDTRDYLDALMSLRA